MKNKPHFNEFLYCNQDALQKAELISKFSPFTQSKTMLAVRKEHKTPFQFP